MAAANRPIVTDRFRAMGSDVVVVVDGSESLAGGAKTRLVQLESVWSRFRPDSDISRLNRSGGWQTVHPDTITLFERAIAAWSETNGAFDPTVLHSLVASGYQDSRSEQRGRTVLSRQPSRSPAPGMSQIATDSAQSTVYLPEGLGFDPGGIGKGLAADLVAEGLIASGAHAAMVAIGGDVRIAGDAPGNWTVEVESPFDRNNTIATLCLLTGAVCTSSVLAKAWVHDAEQIHHIVDPSTGHSSTSSIISATVITADAWMAEALCKAAIMTEPLNAIAFCQSRGVEAIIVDVKGVVWKTDTIGRFAA